MRKRIFSSYRWQLFTLLEVVIWSLIACFIGFQYQRERQYRVSQLDTQLQLINRNLIDHIDNGGNPKTYIKQLIATDKDTIIHNIRVTLIDIDGTVIYDTDSIMNPESHLSRPEVQEALKNGLGYTIQRRSKSTNQEYFYSAMLAPQNSDSSVVVGKYPGYVVRSALPYTVTLDEILTVDKSFLWYMLVLTIIFTLIGYLFTRKLSNNISRLRNFARNAAKEKAIDETQTFSHDELGEISSQIVKLYTQLHKRTAERDAEHQATLEQERDKIRIKHQLTNNINHELKTPVSAIQGYLETLIAHPDIDENKKREWILRCYENNQRLCNLLKDISTITRLEEGSSMITREAVNINNILATEASNVALRPEHQRLRVHIELGDKPVIIQGNMGLIISIFHNLIDNACNYSGGRDIYITLTGENNKSYAFSVSDNGIGVEAQHLAYIFERFYRIDKGRSRAMGGTGLGLSIVKNAILFHGGNISANTNKYGGLELRFTLSKM